MSLELYLQYILESDNDKFKSLPAEKKFHLILQMVKRGQIKNYQDLLKGLKVVGWESQDFLNSFKNLWDLNKIGWEELDILDTNDHLFKGPGFISDRWLTTNIGEKEVCSRIPTKEWDKIPYCRDYKKRSGL